MCTVGLSSLSSCLSSLNATIIGRCHHCCQDLSGVSTLTPVRLDEGVPDGLKGERPPLPPSAVSVYTFKTTRWRKEAMKISQRRTHPQVVKGNRGELALSSFSWSFCSRHHVKSHLANGQDK